MGLNIDKALFTIATTGNKSAIANLVKQLSKLVKVYNFTFKKELGHTSDVPLHSNDER